MPETGVVKWFNNDKGYGFIKRSTGEDVFVHHSSIQASGYRTLNEGERVDFDVKQGPKGLQAENVHRAEGGAHAEEEAV
ncbi:MAG TPA: cold-shock protein [Thermoanaerobaculia bacterium]|nr:cold-shock protein [Thermoanaerobaculia bacterium]